jgi:hypothetical protein
MRVRILIALIIPLTLLAAFAPGRARASERCFAETGYCIDGRVRSFWEQNGGLPVFGLPITPQRAEQVEGRPFQAQWFERARLELHPENAAPYDVLIGRLGADRLAQQGRDWRAFPHPSLGPGCRAFAETGHGLCEPFRSYWARYGLQLDGRAEVSEAESLALFGLPLSDVQSEQIDGVAYQVQWFERARLELHPENAAPYDVLIGLLGGEVRAAAAAPVPTPSPGQPRSPSTVVGVTPTPTRPRRDPSPEPEPTSRPRPSSTPQPRPSPTRLPAYP